MQCVERSSVECAAVYVLARAQAKVNIERLALFRGLSPPAQPDALVAQSEIDLGQRQFATAAMGTAAAGVVLALLGGVLAWQLFGLVAGAVTGS